MILIIDAPHYYAACIWENGKCTKAAPIINWIKNKTLEEAEKYIKYKKFKYQIIKD